MVGSAYMPLGDGQIGVRPSPLAMHTVIFGVVFMELLYVRPSEFRCLYLSCFPSIVGLALAACRFFAEKSASLQCIC